MKLKISAIALTIFTLIIVAYNPAFSDSKLKTIKVVYTDWFPYTYDQNGSPAGFEIEIFQAVIKEMNIEAVFIRYPWKRCLETLKNGEADALISMLYTPERNHYTLYPQEHISISRTVFFTLRNKQIFYNGSLESLKNYTIGVIMGFSYGETFDNADFLKKDEVLDAQKLIKKIVSGRNDIGAENHAVIKAYAMGMGEINKIKFLEPPIHTNKLYVGFSKTTGLRPVCKKFSEILKNFKKTDSYKLILRTYGIMPSEM